METAGIELAWQCGLGVGKNKGYFWKSEGGTEGGPSEVAACVKRALVLTRQEEQVDPDRPKDRMKRLLSVAQSSSMAAGRQ